MRILVKFASRSRPDKFFKCLDNIISMSTSDDFSIIATLDEDDYSMYNDHVRNKLLTYPKVIADWGKSRSKIHAVNRGIEKYTDWDIVIATSDDMEFLEKGFDEQIISDMQAHFPDTDGVLHYKDGFDHGDILSLPIIGKKYFSRFGYIYHPAYTSLFCDEEAIIVAKALNRVHMSDKNLFKHNHPAWIPGLMDRQYKHTESFHPVDMKVFERRKRNNFYLP